MAINDANGGDTIIVSPGTYLENIYFKGKNIILTSTEPGNLQIVATTVITGYGQGSVVTFNSGETSEAVLTGFTITGGYGTVNEMVGEEIVWGAGIYCFNASPTIKNNIIIDNIGPVEIEGDQPVELGYGGGIGCLISSPTITHNIIANNSAYAGGGIIVYVGDAKIDNNLIYNNSATAGGGVVLIVGRLINNTIVGNDAYIGGNAYLVSGPDMGHNSVVNNIISNARSSEGLYREVIYPQDRIAFNNIWGNAGGGDAIWSKDKNPDGNISYDPMFVNLQANDYRLQMDSPCINAGDPNYLSSRGEKDMYGNKRIVHGRVDIGAAEFEGNLRPIADAGDDQSTTVIPDVITLDGSGSYDPDGNENLIYRWSQVAGPNVTIENADKPQAKFTPAEYGDYIFELIVSDGLLDSFPDNVSIVVGSDYIPVADAGLPVYAAQNAVTLDSSKSYDPDNSGELYYYWQQISGPAVVITDSDTANPTVSGFIQTDSLQICEFQLVVYDGQYESLPDIVELKIVPASSGINMRLENDDSFDANKPTVIYFGGGDCIAGGGTWNSEAWEEKANVLSFNYQPDVPDVMPTYERCGDIIIVYLSRVAPHYNQPIQTMGHSTGGQPAIDAAKYLNLTYRDARYAVNRVTFLDARCRSYSSSIIDYLASSVDSEQCWIDTYEGTGPYFYPGILNVQVAIGAHGVPPMWYKNSLTNPDMNQFNGGLVAGAYWSVVGQGKNLQLALTPFEEIYKFHWEGSHYSGYMEFFDESNFPARLPEPVTLIGPVDVGDPNGAVLTCQESENAVGYQLLFGSDPYRVMDYSIISDTPTPPNEVITTLPFEQNWWTMRVYDQYGSTIYADPMRIDALNLSLPIVNVNTGKRYGYIQDAIDEAAFVDEIVLSEGTYYENIDFKGKNVTLRSTNPDDPAVVGATVINGRGQGAVVTFSGGENDNCVLNGFTIVNGHNGTYCSNASAMIMNCIITGNRSAGIKLWDKSNSTITNCVIANNAGAGIELYQMLTRRPNTATIINCTIVGNLQQGIWGGNSTVSNSIIYFNGSNYNDVQIESDLATVTYSDVQSGWPGEDNIDADPLFADPDRGDYHLKSQAGRWDPTSESWVQDDVTSPCIDAGDPDVSIGLEPYPNGSVINIGAYGGTAQASKSP